MANRRNNGHSWAPTPASVWTGESVARIGGAAILGAGAFQFSTLKEGPAMRDMRMG